MNGLELSRQFYLKYGAPMLTYTELSNEIHNRSNYLLYKIHRFKIKFTKFQRDNRSNSEKKNLSH